MLLLPTEMTYDSVTEMTLFNNTSIARMTSVTQAAATATPFVIIADHVTDGISFFLRINRVNRSLTRFSRQKSALHLIFSTPHSIS